MANKKTYYYVLVFTDGGPVYVTSVSNLDRMSYWDKEGKPLSMTRHDAEYLAMGLSWNGNNSVVVCLPYELGNQPYRYSEYEFKFKKIEK